MPSRSNRPSLLQGAIREGGDPNENRRGSNVGNSLSRTSVFSGESEFGEVDPSSEYLNESWTDNAQRRGSTSHSSGGNLYVTDRQPQLRRGMYLPTGDSENVGIVPNESTFISTSNFSQNESTTAIIDDDMGDPSRVQLLCEKALQDVEELIKNEGSKLNVAQMARRQVILDQLWEDIREWFKANQSAEVRHLAGIQQGKYNATALHLICKLHDPPIDVVESLLECSPETVVWPDANGWLPLHNACAHGARGEVLFKLAREYPETKTFQDQRKRTPLHFAFFRPDVRDPGDNSENDRNRNNRPPGSGDNVDNNVADTTSNDVINIISFLCDSQAVEIADKNGLLPLHYACAYGTSREVIQELVEAFPESINKETHSGRLPIHLAMVNAHRDASPSVLQYLLSTKGTDIVNSKDRAGLLPLHLLSKMALHLQPDQPKERANTIQCLKVYLDAKPHSSPDFLTAFQSIAKWLRDEAVTSPHIQDTLNIKIANRFPTSILLLDGYMYIMIIICFQIAAKIHIDVRYSEDGEKELPDYAHSLVIAVFVGGVYFTLREMLQIFSLISLGNFRTWLFSVYNWVDIAVITLIFYHSSVMLNPGTGSRGDFRNGAAITMGALWLAMISFLKSTMLEFAVFVETVVYVTRKLIFFMLALGIILIAFAEMFLILYKGTDVCNPRCGLSEDEMTELDSSQFPHCDFSTSLLKVYTMMLGEIGEVNRYKDSVVAQILYVSFAFLVVILLSNVLIAIVTDSYGVIKNERAETVFWSNRLDFVAEMDAIKVPFKFCFGKWNESGDSGDDGYRENSPQDEHPNPSDQNQNTKDLFRRGWDGLFTFLNEEFEDSAFCEFLLFSFLRMIAITIIIPLWLISGVVTVGWLWPPQVREFLLVQRRTATTQSDISEKMSQEITDMKREIKDLRAEFKLELKSDRKELDAMNIEIEGAQRDIVSDLVQVKEVMKTLLHFARSQMTASEETTSDGF